MANTREIRRRIKAVGNIQRITKTMQMIATAKFQAAAKRAIATKPYTSKVAELVGALAAAASSGGGVEHPLLQPPAAPAGRELLLVITSNRGLCGGYNAGVLRMANQFIKSNPGRRFDIEVVGKKGAGFFRFQRIAVAQSYSQFGDKPAYEEVEAIGNQYVKRYLAGELDAVRVASMHFITNARQQPKIVTLMPMEPPAAGAGAAKAGASAVYEFSPPPLQLLDELLPLAIKAVLFQCFNDAVVSEQVARMVAMKAATDNAGKMRKTLTRKYNRARQTQITTELTEIISGAAALQ